MRTLDLFGCGMMRAKKSCASLDIPETGFRSVWNTRRLASPAMLCALWVEHRLEHYLSESPHAHDAEKERHENSSHGCVEGNQRPKHHTDTNDAEQDGQCQANDDHPEAEIGRA